MASYDIESTMSVVANSWSLTAHLLGLCREAHRSRWEVVVARQCRRVGVGDGADTRSQSCLESETIAAAGDAWAGARGARAAGGGVSANGARRALATPPAPARRSGYAPPAPTNSPCRGPTGPLYDVHQKHRFLWYLQKSERDWWTPVTPEYLLTRRFSCEE